MRNKEINKLWNAIVELQNEMNELRRNKK